MEEIAVEKQNIEEMYRSQSCINFISSQQPEEEAEKSIFYDHGATF